jgi:hypothetical protein
MTDRDERGRFLAGNRLASAGGKARAEKLTPEQRHAIAKAGFAALATKYFDGRRRKCAAWLFDPLGYQTERR